MPKNIHITSQIALFAPVADNYSNSSRFCAKITAIRCLDTAYGRLEMTGCLINQRRLLCRELKLAEGKMIFSAQLCGPDGPFSLEESIQAQFKIGGGQLQLSWRQGEHDLTVRARYRRQFHHYTGQLCDSETNLNLGNVAIEPLTSIFSWQVQLVKPSDGKPLYYPLYRLLLQPLSLSPDERVISFSLGHYLTAGQCEAAISDYLQKWSMLWPLYYAGCHLDNDLKEADILSLAVRRDFSHSAADTIEALWRGRADLAQRIAAIPFDARPDLPDIFNVLTYIVETIPGISLSGASSLVARLRPASMPLLTPALQSWYVSIEDNEALIKVLNEIALDLERNSDLLQKLTYNENQLPPALGWSLALSSISDQFVR